MNEVLKKANTEKMVQRNGIRTGRKYNFYKNMYAVLDSDLNSPLSCISVANNSLSVDLWTGCSFQCAYCHVQGIEEDIASDGKMRKIPMRRNCFTIDEVLSSLVQHPFFKKDVTVISIGTSSTEPFAVGEVLESTLVLMEKMIEMGYKNPFWIVTKAGIPDAAIKRLINISDNISKLIISICWANNPKEIEPVQNNRFKNIDKFFGKNVSINWYLRPITKEWINSITELENMFNMVSKQYGKYIDCIIPGGLRWTEGIEYGMVEVRGLEMPEISKENNQKTLDEEEWKYIMLLAKKYFSEIPVFYHSSCGISFALKRSNICLLQLKNKKECEGSKCTSEQRIRCEIKPNYNLNVVQNELNKVGYDIDVKKIDFENGTMITEPDMNNLSPALKQEIYHIMAFCN